MFPFHLFNVLQSFLHQSLIPFRALFQLFLFRFRHLRGQVDFAELFRGRGHCRSGQLHAHAVKVCRVCSNLPDVSLADADEDVFRFDVSVDDLALGVEVVQTLENLLHDQFHVVKWDSLKEFEKTI